MVRNHRWWKHGEGYTCSRCFGYTADPERRRKGCSIDVNNTLQAMAAKFEKATLQMKKDIEGLHTLLGP